MKQHTLVQRQHPIFSPVAIISTLLLAGTLAVVVYLTGGRAFSPGDLSATNNSGEPVGGFNTHAEFGGDCSYCHEPFQGIAAARCETCHDNVGQERVAGAGVHGRLQSVEVCNQCHLDHRGGDFNMLSIALSDFDHEVTQFSLNKHRRDYDGLTIHCDACHVSDHDFTLQQSACVHCHEPADPPFMANHMEAFGENCVACHDGLDTMATFTLEDHAQVFALTGNHLEITCESCHTNGQFEGAPQECNACHGEPDVHLGLFDTDCAACHTPDGWKPATLEGQSFDHATTTQFSLVKHAVNYNETPFTCRTCHTGKNDFDFDDAQCADCHAAADPQFMTAHTAQFGPNCMSCHDGTGQMADFDHSQIWPLAGQHAVIECSDCHVNRVFKGTLTECVACHEEPAIHFGLFGTDCVNCHTANAWQPAGLTYHSFPLNHGGEGEIACETCHVASYIEYTCYNCHEHNQAEVEGKHQEEGMSPPEITNCVECHPTGREEEGEGGD